MLTLAVALTLSGLAAAALPPGWAQGGKPSAPGTQVYADKQAMPAGCDSNAALLFRVRGSGEDFGKDKLGQWADGAGRALIRAGWQVRDMQAIYPAYHVPMIELLAEPKQLKRYRDNATEWAPRVRKQLEEAWERCKKRTILIAGYSLGNIVLRYVIPALPKGAREQIVSVDLFADPTADGNVDGKLQHPARLDGRRTNAGVDTVGGRTLWKFLTASVVDFKQKAYPDDIAGRVYQYCADGDLVCDFKLGRNPIVDLAVQGRIHSSYGFLGTGVAAARRAGAAGSTPSNTVEVIFRQGASIRARPLSGGAPRTLVSAAASRLTESLDLDVTETAVYWKNSSGIWRADRDGRNPRRVIALDRSYESLLVTGEFLFWTHDDEVWRSRLDGSRKQRILRVPDGPGAGTYATAEDLASDGRHVYFASVDWCAIGRMRLDGSDAQLTFISGLYGNLCTINTVAVVNEYLYWALAAGGAAYIGRARLDGSAADPRWFDTRALHGLFRVRGWGDTLLWKHRGLGPDRKSYVGKVRISTRGEVSRVWMSGGDDLSDDPLVLGTYIGALDVSP